MAFRLFCSTFATDIILRNDNFLHTNKSYRLSSRQLMKVIRSEEVVHFPRERLKQTTYKSFNEKEDS